MLSDKTINKEVPIPLYYQLKSIILEEIKDGSYKPGDLIPTEDELGKMFDISRTTVRQAITELVNEGYVYRVKSKGTFVSAPKLKRRLPYSEYYSSNNFTFSDSVLEAGKKEKTENREVKVIDTPDIMKEQGYDSPSGKVVSVFRVHYSDGEPFESVVSYLDYDRFSYLLRSNELETHTIGEIMHQKEETRVRHMYRTIEALIASSQDVKVLGAAPKSAVLLLTTVRRDKDGRLLDISLNRLRGDKAKLSFKTEIMEES